MPLVSDLRHVSGAASELFVAYRLTELGYQVSRPFMTQSEYDLVVDHGNGFSSLQVKKATWSRTGKFRYLQSRVVSKDKRRYKVNVDFFAFTDNKRVWLVEAIDLEGMTSVCLDCDNPDYKPYTKYRAEDWLI